VLKFRAEFLIRFLQPYEARAGWDWNLHCSQSRDYHDGGQITVSSNTSGTTVTVEIPVVTQTNAESVNGESKIALVHIGDRRRATASGANFAALAL
jgi:hypothetical protein